jgi:hypothetical protein
VARCRPIGVPMLRAVRRSRQRRKNADDPITHMGYEGSPIAVVDVCAGIDRNSHAAACPRRRVAGVRPFGNGSEAARRLNTGDTKR